MEPTLIFYLCAMIGVLIMGLAKGGFVGAGALAMPIMVLGMPPLQAAAILAPILVLQDVVSVWAFRKSWSKRNVKLLAPSMAIGVALGYFLAAQVTPEIVMLAIGVIALVFGAYYLRREILKQQPKMRPAPDWLGRVLGIVTGFTSQIAHAGAPPFQVWLFPQRLPRDELVGTTAISFALLNFMKLFSYGALGQFTIENLRIFLLLAPFALLSTLLGVFLVRRTPVHRFYPILYILMMGVGVKLVGDAIANFL